MPFHLVLARVDALHYVFMIPLALLSVFLILLILVQRGRGGGLTGALGGMGGQSAFGTKAGDLFTRITIIVAAIWVLLSMASLKILNQRSASGGLSGNRAPTATTPVSGSGGVPVTGSDKTGSDKKAEGEKSAEGSKEGATGTEKDAPAETTPATTPAAPADTGAKPGDASKP